MLRLSNRRGPASDDGGFTLIELVVTVAILGIVVSSLVGMVFQYMRQTNETSTRLNESSEQQFVSAYWQQDVGSLGLHGFVSGATNPLPTSTSIWMGSAPAGCAAAGAVVSFGWNDYQTASTTDVSAAWSGPEKNYAVYYATTDGPQTVLHRKRCGGTNSDIVLARYLDGVPTADCRDGAGAVVSCPDVPYAVSLTMKVRDFSEKVHNATGYTTTLTAQRRQG